jgi:hypothetical protein
MMEGFQPVLVKDHLGFYFSVTADTDQSRPATSDRQSNQDLMHPIECDGPQPDVRDPSHARITLLTTCHWRNSAKWRSIAETSLPVP